MAGGAAPVAGWFSNQWRYLPAAPRDIFMKKKWHVQGRAGLRVNCAPDRVFGIRIVRDLAM